MSFVLVPLNITETFCVTHVTFFFYSGSSKMSEDSFFSMPFLTLDVNPSVSAGLPQQCLNLKLIECHVADELWRDLKRQWGYGNAH